MRGDMPAPTGRFARSAQDAEVAEEEVQRR
jgi:hypothetical protein